MPGAPNKPPESAAAPEPVAAAGDAGRHVLRRLGLAHVILRLECWKGAPNPDLVRPVAQADRLYEAGDFPNAEMALDQFSVRLAEPRWPSIPEPFRRLRVDIVRPEPPAWNPDNALTPAERAAKTTRRFAENQLLWAEATLTEAPRLGAEVTDLPPLVSEAREKLAAEGPDEAFWSPLERFWETVRARVPLPSTAAARPAPEAKLPPGIAPDEA
jgi:hypothetical protein